MKRGQCVQVNHHANVGSTIEDWEENGWRLHTYAVAQLRGSEMNHYLLFEKEEQQTPEAAQRMSHTGSSSGGSRPATPLKDRKPRHRGVYELQEPWIQQPPGPLIEDSIHCFDIAAGAVFYEDLVKGEPHTCLPITLSGLRIC